MRIMPLLVFASCVVGSVLGWRASYWQYGTSYLDYELNL